jgi:small subunit ribosomal protein S6
MQEQKMYEIGYLLSPLVPEEKLDEEISALRKLIEDRKGFIMNEGRLKSRKLAYPINKFETAYFGWMKFLVNPEDVSKVKSSFKNPPSAQGGGGDKIIRFLITQIIAEKTAPIITKKIVKKKKVAVPKPKPEIKIEEIDKKIEELIGSSQ